MESSREKIKKVIAHKETSRLPIDLGGSPVTSVATIAYNKLRQSLGLSTGSNLPRMYDFYQQLAFTENEIHDYFHADTIHPGQSRIEYTDWTEFEIPNDGTKCLIPGYLTDLFDIERDEEQTIWVSDKEKTVLGKMPKSSTVVDQIYWPYGNLDAIPEKIEDPMLKKQLWSIPTPPGHLSVFDENEGALFTKIFEDVHGNTDCFILHPVGGNIFDIGFQIRRMDNFLCDVYLDPKGTERLVAHLTENSLRFIQKVMERAGEYIDALIFFDDLSHQSGTFISPEVYRKIFKPYHKKMWDCVHQSSDCKVFFHCCGAIYSLIPDLIEAGVDILNPVQIGAIDMDPVRLKREFGRDITFWGGSCDTKTLSLGDPEDVREEVKRNTDIFRKEGGYVFSSIHNITAEVKPENIIAMFETAARV